MRIPASNGWALRIGATAAVLLLAVAAGCAPQPPAHAMVGQAAPDVELDTLDGGTFRLGEHQGQHVVLLDFWATWCGPCVESMPEMADLARQHQAEGLRVVAVNQRETPEQVAAFVERHGLDLQVALDADGQVSRSYQVRGLPTAVLIDRTGTIRAFHEGTGPGMKDRLSGEIRQLLRERA